MKIVINIEKKHFYILLGFIILVGIGVVIASTWNPSQQSHTDLWTQNIYGKNVNTIQVYDSLNLQPGQSLCLNGVCQSSWPTSSLSGTGTANYLTKWTGTNTIGASTIPESSVVTKSGTPIANYLTKFTGTGSIENSGIYESGGNFGIGTTSPTAKLDVVGSINAGGALQAASITSNTILVNGNSRVIFVRYHATMPCSTVCANPGGYNCLIAEDASGNTNWGSCSMTWGAGQNCLCY